MEELLEKLGWKKLALIVVPVTVVFLIFVFISIFQNNHGPSGSNVKTTPVTKSDTPGSFSVPSAGSFKNDYYTVEYPSYYNVNTEPQDGALQYTVLKDRASNAQ